MSRPRMLAAALVAAAVLAGCATPQRAVERPAESPAAPTPAPTAEAPAAGPPPGGYVDIVAEVTPSVVTIQSRAGLGSGVVLATDPMTDLAVLRTRRTGLPVPRFRTDLPRPGEAALAIGSPLGFEHSVTAGIISGLHRDIPGAAAHYPSLVDLIQTDASISPGSSGGALLDAEGRVVGINEAYIPPSAGAVSLGFAIPSGTVLDVADQLLADGRAVHPYLGVSAVRLTPAIRRFAGVEVDQGALVVALDADAPAAAAGVRRGDVIVEFAGSPIRSLEDLLATLRRTKPGQQHPLVFVRGDKRQQVSVTVGAAPS